MTARRRRSERRELAKPDYSDAGFGEIGCLFIVGGMAVGVVATVVLAILGVPVALVDNGDAWTTLIGIGAFAYAAGTAAAVVTSTVIEHVPALWRFEAVPYVVGAPAAAVVIPLAAFVPGWGAAMGPIVLVIVALVVGIPVLIWLVRISMPGPPEPPSRYGR